MKLNLLFIVMELLIVLAYPVVFMHGKLRRFPKLEEGIFSGKFFVNIPAETGR